MAQKLKRDISQKEKSKFFLRNQLHSLKKDRLKYHYLVIKLAKKKVQHSVDESASKRHSIFLKEKKGEKSRINKLFNS